MDKFGSSPGTMEALGLCRVGHTTALHPPQHLASLCSLPDVLVLLMTDVLIFLQEKDQKYTFPMLVS